MVNKLLENLHVTPVRVSFFQVVLNGKPDVTDKVNTYM